MIMLYQTHFDIYFLYKNIHVSNNLFNKYLTKPSPSYSHPLGQISHIPILTISQNNN